MAAAEEPGDRRGAERAKVLDREAEEEEESLDLEARRIEETVEAMIKEAFVCDEKSVWRTNAN